MFNPLTAADFPLIAIGANVYRRAYSSPIFTAPSDAMAADLVFRLNDQEMRKYSAGAIDDWRNTPEQVTTLVFGKMTA